MKRKMITAVICVLVVLAVGMYFHISENPKEYVAKVGKEFIMPNEFYLYLYEQKIRFEEKGESDIWEMSFDEETPAESVAKQNALEGNIMVKITVAQTDSLGITLSEDEQKEAMEWARGALQGFGVESIRKTGISEEVLRQIYEENILYGKVFHEVTKNFVLNENDFETFFESHKMQREGAENLFINYIFIEGGHSEELLEKAQYIMDMLIEGKDFGEVSEGYVYENFVNVDEPGFDSKIWEEAYSLSNDEYKMIETTAGYYIIQLADVEAENPNLPEISRLTAENEYIMIKKTELFQQEYGRWSESINVVQNQQALNSISVHDLN